MQLVGHSVNKPSDSGALPCRLPRTVYHLTEESAWQRIQMDGMHSALDLLKASTLSIKQQETIASSQRLTNLKLAQPACLLHDQKPLPASGLRRCLHGVDPPDWYRLVNSQVSVLFLF